MTVPTDCQHMTAFSFAATRHGTGIGFERAEVHGIVLAGVHSWGDCLLDEVICRPAVPIGTRPLICHCLRWLREQGIRTASLCANSDTDYLRRYLGDGAGMGLALDYYEDVMPRGPAGSLHDAAVVSGASVFVVVYGTVLPRIDLAELLQTHEAAGACVTVVAARTAGGSLQPVGIYVFAREALGRIPARGYQDIKETLLPKLHAEGKRVVMHVVDDAAVGRVMDTRSYVSVSRWAVEGLLREAEADGGYLCIGEARVHETAVVDATARLIGPVIVEPHCVISREVMIIGPTAIGKGCTIASRAVVSRSIVWSGCRIGEGAIVDDSVLTHQTTIERELVVRSTVSRKGGGQYV